MSLGANIKGLREAKGWSQSQLAGKIGKTRVYVTRLEQDAYKSPGLDVLIKLAIFMDTSVESLFDMVAQASPEASVNPNQAEFDDLVVYLQLRKPDARTLRQLKQIAMVLIGEQERELKHLQEEKEE